MAENAVNEFSQQVVSEWRANHLSESLIFSPLSIAMCFLLVYHGAAGKTKLEIEDLFGFDDKREKRRLSDKMDDYSRHSAAKMANRVYVEEELKIKNRFVRDVGRDNLEHVDFVHGYDAVGRDINAWVAEKTEGMIPEIIPPGVLDANTALVAVNALYFKDKWQTQFSPQDTADGIFHGVGGDQTVPFMMLRHKEILLKRVPSLDSILFKLPYNGGEFSMYVLLPDKKDGWKKAEKNLASEIDSLFQGGFASIEAGVFKLPKWELELSLEGLEEILHSLGLTTAFGEDANFQGITNYPPLAISNVLHKAKIVVDEEGTEAAASTGLRIAARMMLREYYVDRPFIYFIVDEKDAMILFQGTQTRFPTTQTSIPKTRAGQRKGHRRRVHPPTSPPFVPVF